MKFLSKINRGLILLTVVILAVAIYLMCLSAAQAKDKPVVQKICEDYINTAVSYKTLPDKYIKENPDITQDELNKYLDSMSKEFKTFYPDNAEAYKYLIERNKEELENQAKGQGVVFKYNKDIKEFSNFVFEGNSVTVSILTSTVMDGSSALVPGSPREKISSRTTDTMILNKIKGNWKVVYADLQDPVDESRGQIPTYRASFE